MGWLKQILPRSLFGRWLVLLAAPVVLLQIVSAVVFYRFHWDTVSRRLALGVAGEIAMLIDARQLIPDPVAHERLRSLVERHMQLSAEFLPGERLSGGSEPRFLSILDAMLDQAMGERVMLPFETDTRRSDGIIEIRVAVPDGVLRVRTLEKRLFSSTSYVFMIWMVGSSIVLLGIAVLFLRNQVRPIRRLAEAADAFGKGRETADFRPHGATEVRRAASAFQAMQRRIQRQIQQRTEMLAGVSHDLRTPLTRLRLQLEMLGDAPGVADMKRDLAEMQVMIDGYLAFARGEDGEVAVNVDLPDLLQEIAADMRRQGGDVQYAGEREVELPVRPNALRRCVVNLVENALRHATRVKIGLRRLANAVEIVVDDDGPGIPAHRRDEAFRPFSRLDPSRSRATGGVGLGLTIARDVARAHGGELTLDTAPEGGLRALVRLPV